MKVIASRWYSALVTAALLVAAVAVPMGWSATVSAVTPDCDDSGSFSGGDGSSAAPFQISSPGDLMHLSASTSAWTGKHFVQTATLDMTGCVWTPIGTPGWRQGGIPFKGSYDGVNFAIDNLSVTAADDYRGLFGWAEDSTFRRMDLDIVITGADDTVGGLIGYAEGVTIADVDITVVISGLTGGNVGGLIGEGGDATISATTVTGTVESGGGFATGGLIGMTYYNGLTITDVTVSADVMHPVTEDASVGGLIGESSEAETVISRASFSGRVSASAQSSAGGFVGVGGFVGNQRFGDLTITTSSIASGSTVVGGRKVGGLIGRLEANAAGELVDIADTAVAAAVTGTGDDVGGLIGAVEVSGTGTTMSVSNTSVTGTLTSSASNAGGLMGYVQVGAATRPAGLVTIDGATATVNVTAATTSAGGLIGYVTTSGQTTVFAAQNVTATGNVTMPRTGYQAGGLIGFLGGDGMIGVQNATASGDVNIGMRSQQVPVSGAGGAFGVVNSTGVVSLATVSATGDVFGRGGSLGGLVGSMRVTANSRGPKVLMANVSATGNVVPTLEGALWVGGLVGDLTAYELEMTEASATGTVLGAGEVGGLVGSLNITGRAAFASSFMTRVSAQGSVTSDLGRAGGLLGFLGAEGELLLSDASATGNVDAGSFRGDSLSGGLIGMLAVENRENSHVTILRSSATNDVEGDGGRLGGLVGFVSMPSGIDVGVDITESYTMQSVRVADGSSVTSVGGLIGEVKATYGPLTISDSYSHRELFGDMTDAGGLIGRADAGSAGVEIVRSYATNPFPGYPLPDPQPPFGGLIGVTASAGAPVSVSASFRESAGGTSIGTAATRTELQAVATFSAAGWSISNGVSDVTKTWAICSGQVYPFLMWQSDLATAWLDGAFTCGGGESGGDDGSDASGPVVPPVLPPALPGLVNQPVSTPPTVPPTTVPSTTPPTTTVAPPSTVPTPVPASGGVLPSLAPGASQVQVDGRPVAVDVFVDNATDLVMRGDDFELRLAGDCAGGCTIETTADGRQVLTLEERGLAKVDGDGFRPGTPVYVWLFSEPRFLGELTVNADGTFTGSVPLGDIVPGEHTLQVNGTSFDGRDRTANLGVVVNPTGAPSPEGGGVLPATGRDVTSWWMMATVMIVIGLGALGRRRHEPIC